MLKFLSFFITKSASIPLILFNFNLNFCRQGIISITSTYSDSKFGFWEGGKNGKSMIERCPKYLSLTGSLAAVTQNVPRFTSRYDVH